MIDETPSQDCNHAYLDENMYQAAGQSAKVLEHSVAKKINTTRSALVVGLAGSSSCRHI